MAREVKIGSRWVGDNHPAYLVAEIGVNHNGSVEIAKKLVREAQRYGVSAVKFQKRTPELCVPRDQWDIMRETPWGYISYIEYRRKMEFQQAEYNEIDSYCKELEIDWFASVWDEPSIEFLEAYNPICYKVPSASLTDHSLLSCLRATGRPVILSTGMSTMEQIHEAVCHLDMDKLVITHATSTYPCDPSELNLHVIEKLRNEFPCPIGYSGHEVGLITSVVAVALGACMVERHITLDRAMWGSDQAASVEPQGFERLVKYVRVTEQSLGDGEKRVYESEIPSMRRLRRMQ
jgi:N-acetylneuraminate synthase